MELSDWIVIVFIALSFLMAMMGPFLKKRHKAYFKQRRINKLIRLADELDRKARQASNIEKSSIITQQVIEIRKLVIELQGNN